MFTASFALSTGHTFPAGAHPPPTPTAVHHLRCSLRVAVATATETDSSLYEVLGIQACATQKEIKSAYRRLARVLHPDTAAGHGDEFMRVHAAYATLSDPEKRAVYDGALFLRRQRPRPRPLGGEAAAPRRRTWETDQCW